MIDHTTFVQAQLDATLARIDGARTALGTAAEPDWLRACAEREHPLDQHALAAGDDLPAGLLRSRLGLTASEVRMLWVLVAHELRPAARAALRAINTEQLSDVTVDTLRRVTFGSGLGLTTWRELGPESALRRLHLLDVVSGGDGPEQRATLRVSRRVLALVHGDIRLDAEIAELIAPAPRPLALPDLEVDEQVAQRATEALQRAGLTVFTGPAGIGRRSLLFAAARITQRRLLALDGRLLAPERARARRQLEIVAREARLFAMTPLLLHLDALGPAGDVPDRLDLVEHAFEGTAVATAARPVARRWRMPTTTVELPALTGAQRARLWRRALPAASQGDAELLATMDPLAPALITAAGATALRTAGERPVQPDHVEAGIRAVLDDRLAGLATRITVTQTWDDVVLHDDQTAAMLELLARVRKRHTVYEQWGFADKLGRGLGVSALFSGPPGTGKTMCAGLIAKDLRTEVYQVDLSKVVSKWIGETEKNLGAVFDAAEAGHAVLLFDEADALFGKRTDVKSSNDRHANQEVNFLLQRLESYVGICILTTNHETAIDEAFRRRLSVHVRFATPDLEERRRLWRAMLPSRAPRALELGLDGLAEQFAMSGGYIRNAALRAAFIAADEDAPIGPHHLRRAAQLEYEALGKLSPGALAGSS